MATRRADANANHDTITGPGGRQVPRTPGYEPRHAAVETSPMDVPARGDGITADNTQPYTTQPR